MILHNRYQCRPQRAPWRLPSLHNYLGTTEEPAPHRAASRGLSRSGARVSYYFYGFVFGYQYYPSSHHPLLLPPFLVRPFADLRATGRANCRANGRSNGKGQW